MIILQFERNIVDVDAIPFDQYFINFRKFISFWCTAIRIPGAAAIFYESALVL